MSIWVSKQINDLELFYGSTGRNSQWETVVVVVDPKLLSSSLLYSQCQADESAFLLQLV